MPPKKKFFHTCPHCGFTKDGGAEAEKQFGGPKFGKHVVSLATIITGIRAIDIKGKPKAPRFSQARVAVMIAMKDIAKLADANAPWALCGEAIGRDKGSSHRMYNTWRDDPVVVKNAAAIVDAYSGAA